MANYTRKELDAINRFRSSSNKISESVYSNHEKKRAEEEAEQEKKKAKTNADFRWEDRFNLDPKRIAIEKGQEDQRKKDTSPLVQPETVTTSSGEKRLEMMYPVQTQDGKVLGHATFGNIKAAEQGKEYTPINDKEKKVLDNYSTYRKSVVDSMTNLTTPGGSTFGRVTSGAMKAIEDGTLNSYKPFNNEEKQTIDNYKRYNQYKYATTDGTLNKDTFKLFQKYDIDPASYSWDEFVDWAESNGYVQDKNNRLAVYRDKSVGAASDSLNKEFRTLQNLGLANDRKKEKETDKGSFSAFASKFSTSFTPFSGAINGGWEKLEKGWHQDAGLNPEVFVSQTDVAESSQAKHPTATSAGNVIGTGLQMLGTSKLLGPILGSVDDITATSLKALKALKAANNSSLIARAASNMGKTKAVNTARKLLPIAVSNLGEMVSNAMSPEQSKVNTDIVKATKDTAKKNHWVGAVNYLANAITNLYKMPGRNAEIGGAILNSVLSGNKQTLDNLSSMWQSSANLKAAREGILEDTTGVPKFLWEMGLMTGDNIIRNVIGGADSSMVFMAGNVFAESVKDSYDLTGDIGTSAMNGFLQMASEYITEQIPTEMFWDAINNPTSRKALIGNILAALGIDGLGEGASDVMGNMFEQLFLGEKSGYSQLKAEAKELYLAEGYTDSQAESKATKDAFMQTYIWQPLRSTAQGFFSGGLMQGGANAIGTISKSLDQKSALTKLGEKVVENSPDDIPNAVDYGKAQTTDKAFKKLADGVGTDLVKSKGLNSYEVGKLMSKYYESQMEDAKKDITEIIVGEEASDGVKEVDTLVVEKGANPQERMTIADLVKGIEPTLEGSNKTLTEVKNFVGNLTNGASKQIGDGSNYGSLFSTNLEALTRSTDDIVTEDFVSAYVNAYLDDLKSENEEDYNALGTDTKTPEEVLTDAVMNNKVPENYSNEKALNVASSKVGFVVNRVADRIAESHEKIYGTKDAVDISAPVETSAEVVLDETPSADIVITDELETNLKNAIRENISIPTASETLIETLVQMVVEEYNENGTVVGVFDEFADNGLAIESILYAERNKDNVNKKGFSGRTDIQRGNEGRQDSIDDTKYDGRVGYRDGRSYEEDSRSGSTERTQEVLGEESRNTEVETKWEVLKTSQGEVVYGKMPDDWYKTDTMATKVVKDNAAKGLKTVFFKGSAFIKGQTIKGFVHKGVAYIQVDNPVYSTEQINGHEVTHEMTDSSAYNILLNEVFDGMTAEEWKSVYDAMYSRYQNLAEAYVKAKRKSNPSITDTQALGMIEEYIWEEMMCDLVGGIDEMSAYTDRFAFAVKRFKANAYISPEKQYLTSSKASTSPSTYTQQTDSGGDDFARYSVSSLIEGVGLDYLKDEKGEPLNGEVTLTLNGKRISPDEITGELLLQTDSAYKTLVGLAETSGTMSKAQIDKSANDLAEIIKMAMDFGNPQDGVSTVSLIDAAWRWKIYNDVFKPVKANSDKQYNKSIDMGTICKKTAQVLKSASAMQTKLGRGLTPAEMLQIYYNTGSTKNAEGRYYQTPCPVCYVFAHWINRGNTLNTVVEAQKQYEDVLKKDMTDKERRAYWTKELAKHEKFAKDNEKAIEKAKEAIKVSFDKIDSLSNELANATDSAEKTRIAKEIKAVNDTYKKAMNLVMKSDLAGWIKNTQLKEDKGGNLVPYKIIPLDILLDYDNAYTIARDYPLVHGFFTSKGSAGGKTMETSTNNEFGAVIMGLGQGGVDYATNWFTEANNPNISAKARDNAKEQAIATFTKAINNMKAQALRGGQRLFSWSDYLVEEGPDMYMVMLQLQMVGASVQSYSKQLEALEFLGALNGYCNGSLIAKGDGYDENGNLVFSNIQGINAEKCFEICNKYNKAGNILVGMTDKHIQIALNDDRIYFVIPYHASSLAKGTLKRMLEMLGETTKYGDRSDYTNLQSEKWDKMTDDLKAVFEKIKVIPGNNFASGGEISTEQYRDIRKNIINGNPTASDIAYAKQDEFLNQLYNTIFDADGNRVVTMKTDDTKAIYPYEYWDKTSTYETADVNGIRYLEYCRRLGVQPKFCGLDNTSKAVGYGDFTETKGYWKLLVDRRMYARDGSYQDTESVDVTGFSTDLINPDKIKDTTTKADDEGAARIADKTIKSIAEKYGDDVVRFSVDSSYFKAVEDNDVETQQKIIDDVAKASGYTIKAYHGTQTGGDTVFDPKKSDDGISLFFTDSVNVASTYAGDVSAPKELSAFKSKFKYERGKKYTAEELKEAHDVIQSKYHIYGKTTINEEKQTVYHAGQRMSAKQVIELADRIIRTGIYSVYLKPNNMLEIDAQGVGPWHIKVPGNGYMSTREISKFAKEQGYGGAIITNLYDFGGRNRYHKNQIPATIYIVLDPNDVKSADPITYDDNGNIIPPSQRFNTKEDDIRFSINDIKASLDTEYLKLAENPKQNDAKLREMVYDAALDAGLKHVGLHGTDAFGFTTFNKDKSAKSQAFFFTNKYRVAETYSGVSGITRLTSKASQGNYEVALDMKKPLEVDCNGRVWNNIPYDIGKKGKVTTNDIVAYAKENGYDSVVFRNILDPGPMLSDAEEQNIKTSDEAKKKWSATVYAVFEPEQIKSLDPVTYDNNGNVIPLSKRFNPDNNDIRFSINSTNEELAKRDDTAIFIKNTKDAKYIDMILDGEKTEETRTKPTLDAFIGKEQFVTDGKKVYGKITLGVPHPYTADEFHLPENEAKHRVPVGDEYDITEGGIKYAYPITSYEKFDEPLTLSKTKDYKGTRQARQVVFDEPDDGIRFSVENGRIKFTPEHQKIYEELMQKYGKIPKGSQPRARDIEVPQAISDTQKVSRNARTFMEAEATPDEALSEFGKAILEGKMGGEVITNSKAEQDARDVIRKKGFDNAYDDWMRKVEEGEMLNKYDTVLGQVLYNNAINSKDVSRAMKLATNLVLASRNAGQVVQAAAMIKKMSPEGQLYYIKRTADRLNRDADNYKLITDAELTKLFDAFLKEEDVGKREGLYKRIEDLVLKRMNTTPKALERLKQAKERTRLTDEQIEEIALLREQVQQNKKDAKALERYKELANKYKLNAVQMAELAKLRDEVKRGRAVEQAMALLNKAKKNLKSVPSKEVVDRVSDLASQLRKIQQENLGIVIDESLLRDFLDAKTKEERDAVYDKICLNIANQMPATLREQWDSWRYLAMLGNPRTHIRNILGNGVFSVAVKLKNFVTWGLEKTISKDQRTKALKVTKEAKEFAEKDFEEIKSLLQGDNDKYALTDDISKHRKMWDGKLTKYVEYLRKKNFDFLEGEDMWFLSRYYKRALASVISARGIDVNKIDADMLNKLREYALKQAKEATFRDDNALAEAISKGSRYLNQGGKNKDNAALKATGFLVEGVMPFKKTPLNIAKQGLNYSPYGVLKAICKKLTSLKNGNYTATEIIEDLAKGLTGSSIMALGCFLAGMGWLTGPDDEDKKKRAFDKMVGEQPYSLKLPWGTYTIDWMAPASLPLFVGYELFNQFKDKDYEFGDISKALGRISEPLLELSVLSGVSDVIASATYNESDPIISVTKDALFNYVTQAFPTMGGQIARIIDPTQRNYYYSGKGSSAIKSLVSQVASKIPGASYLFTPQLDIWGRDKEYGNIIERVLENTVSPGYWADENYTSVDRYLQELYETTGDSSVLPTTPQKRYVQDGVVYELDAEQYAESSRIRGQKSHELIKDNLSRLRRMDDEDAVKLIEKLYREAGTYTKEKMLKKIK